MEAAAAMHSTSSTAMEVLLSAPVFGMLGLPTMLPLPVEEEPPLGEVTSSAPGTVGVSTPVVGAWVVVCADSVVVVEDAGCVVVTSVVGCVVDSVVGCVVGFVVSVVGFVVGSVVGSVGGFVVGSVVGSVGGSFVGTVGRSL